MRQVKQICLSCKFFRLEDIHSGLCRVSRSLGEKVAYPMMKNDDTCPNWKDSGQQYYIRTGWIKSKMQEVEGGEESN